MKKKFLVLLLLVPVITACPGTKRSGKMDSFRYELHSGAETAVFYTHLTEDGASLYFRFPGSMEGWHISSVDPSVLTGLEEIVRKDRLMKSKDGDLDSERKSDDRRVIMISFSDGRKKDILDYLDCTQGTSELDREIISYFDGVIGENGADGFTCQKTMLEYDENGKIIRKTTYEYQEHP